MTTSEVGPATVTVEIVVLAGFGLRWVWWVLMGLAHGRMDTATKEQLTTTKLQLKFLEMLNQI